VGKVESFECMVFLDTTIEMNTTLLAGMTLDGGAFINDAQLVLVGRHREIRNGNNSDNREESACRLPALRTPTGVIVKDIAGDGDLYFVTQAMAMQLSTGEVIAALCKAIIYQRMKRIWHCVILLCVVEQLRLQKDVLNVSKMILMSIWGTLEPFKRGFDRPSRTITPS
jgi:hypothetical protein